MNTGGRGSRYHLWTRAVVFLCRKPAPPLRRHVTALWYCHGFTAAHAKDRILPDGAATLIFNLAEDETRVYDRHDTSKYLRTRGASITGPQTEHFIIDTAEQYSVVSAEFKPGGTFPFFGLPASELHGMHASLDELWGTGANTIRERLLEAATPDARLAALESELLARLRPDVQVHPAVRHAVERIDGEPGVVTVSEVTNAIGLSPRRFIELFRQQVGMTPKLYCRVQRFQQVVRAVSLGREARWTDVAAEAGYFDQSHFIHDFRAFSGMNPGRYAASGPYWKHSPILDV
jgi:AraC-like DNA-binding protein